jgi:hypothetical protein
VLCQLIFTIVEISDHLSSVTHLDSESMMDPDQIKTSMMEVLRTQEFANIIQTAIHQQTAPLKENLECLASEMKTLKMTVAKLNAEITNIKRGANAIETKIDGERLYNIRVSGLTEGNKEVMKEDFVMKIKEYMQIELSQSEIDVRLPNMPAKPGNELRPRPVTVKFRNIWKRREVWDSRLKLKGSDIFLSDDLNKDQSKLFYQCRMHRKERKIISTWTNGNKLYVKVKEGDEPILISSEADLESCLSLNGPERGSITSPSALLHTTSMLMGIQAPNQGSYHAYPSTSREKPYTKDLQHLSSQASYNRGKPPASNKSSTNSFGSCFEGFTNEDIKESELKNVAKQEKYQNEIQLLREEIVHLKKLNNNDAPK